MANHREAVGKTIVFGDLPADTGEQTDDKPRSSATH
jgi:hypothetical protein